MALQAVRTCPCWEGKIFATAGSLRTHRLSQRHQLYEARLEIADLRMQLAQSVNARRALERRLGARDQPSYDESPKVSKNE